jgi:CRP-like cAMP-binding protein
MIYFIETGQIKLLMLSSEGKECILGIHTAGDIFGELCLSGLGKRLEPATAMKSTSLKQIPSIQFFARVGRDSLWQGFVRYLAVRIADQQQIIANLVTAIASSAWARHYCSWRARLERRTGAVFASSLESRMKSYCGTNRPGS